PAAIFERGGGKQVAWRLDRDARFVRIVQCRRNRARPGRLGGGDAVEQDFGLEQMAVVSRMPVASLARRQEKKTKAGPGVADHRWPEMGEENCTGLAHKPTCLPGLMRM